MLEIKSFGHISIAVPNVQEAADYYQSLFGTELLITFENCKNEGISKNMGLEDADISIRALKFTHCNLVLELMQFNHPVGDSKIHNFQLNDLGGPRHISLQVEDVGKAFDFIKGKEDVQILNTEDFRPVSLSSISLEQFKLGETDEDSEAKKQIVKNFPDKRFFYFRDRFGVIWEIEDRIFDHHT